MEKPNIHALPEWARPLYDFAAGDEREAQEQAIILNRIAAQGESVLVRSSEDAHMTASAIIVNRERTKTLMAFHKIYNSWAWTGGHADGQSDLLAVALREAQEETGITGLRLLRGGIASMEILPVWAHVKRGKWVSSHLHLNVSFLFEADDTLPLRIAKDENSAVGWIDIAQLEEKVSEPPMLPIYQRLLQRANDC